jgi:NAD(P)H dehydrogenase (quinone)
VYASAVSPGEDDHLTGAHPATERLLRGSGLGWTALRATLYMSLFDEDVRAAARLGEFATSMGAGKAALIDRWDLARADAAVLADPAGHDGQAYTITGPGDVGAAEIAQAASDLSAKPVAVRRLSRAATAKALRARGLSPRDVDVTLGLEDKVRSNVYAGPTRDLSRLAGDAGSSFRHTMRRRLAGDPPL